MQTAAVEQNDKIYYAFIHQSRAERFALIVAENTSDK